MREQYEGAGRAMDAPKAESHVERFISAAEHVRTIERKLERLISDIQGPKPELANGPNKISTERLPSLMEMLDSFPTGVHETCERAEKAIEQLRVMLRVY